MPLNIIVGFFLAMLYTISYAYMSLIFYLNVKHVKHLTHTMESVKRMPLDYIEGEKGDLWILAGKRVVMYMTPQGDISVGKDFIAYDTRIPGVPEVPTPSEEDEQDEPLMCWGCGENLPNDGARCTRCT
jgi:hypothetical protein